MTRPVPGTESWHEPPEDVLARALELALPDRPVPRRTYARTTRRVITRRGLLWLGQTCNLRCSFCYYLDRIEDAHHPEHAFMSLEKAKRICRTLVDVYGNNSLDIQGGEPTIWPHILELVRYCDEIGLSPTIITNGQALDRPDRVHAYRDAGLRDFIVSVQALGPVYDALVGRRGAHVRQMKALRNLQEVGIPFRFNTVLTKAVVPQLAQIAELGVRTGAFVVNFIAYNPFDDQRVPGKRSPESVPSYTEVGRALDEALDLLAAAGVEANVRFLPLCAVAERHRASAYTFAQLSYDHHENDFASWSWTGMQPQRMRDGDLTPPLPLGPRIRLGLLRAPARRLGRLDRVGPPLYRLKRELDRRVANVSVRLGARPAREDLYRRDAKLRALEHLGYRHVHACGSCDLREICDGFHGDYAELHGTEEARPVRMGGRIDSATHFILTQEKAVHPADARWILGEPRPERAPRECATPGDPSSQ